MAKKKPPRHWQEIAEEIRNEKDTGRRDELIRELDRALHEDSRRMLRVNGRTIFKMGDVPEK